MTVQHVSYWQNDIEYAEGPFVVCDLPGQAYRIEAEMLDHHTSVYTHHSVYEVQRQLGMVGNTDNRTLVDGVCGVLNRMVTEGKIVRLGREWVTLAYYEAHA